MEDRVEISLLMDLCGPLLAEKQYRIMKPYCNEDLSLAEIAELNNTSRQAIHDLIKRYYKQFLSYESKLNLLKKNFNQGRTIISLLEDLKDKYSISEDDYNKYKGILEDL